MSDHDAAQLLAQSRLEQWPPQWTPTAVVMDMDGTLVDTEAAWVKAQDEYLAAHDTSFDDATRRSITGSSAAVVLEALAEAVGKEPQQVNEELVRDHRENIEEHMQELPGAADLARLIAARLPFAIASNSSRKMLDKKLAALELESTVDASVAVEDIDNAKPAPDIYLRACELLGVDPAECLAIEDSETGAAAAVAAGMQVIVVPSIPGQNPHGHRRLESLEDPVLREWVQSWKAKQ